MKYSFNRIVHKLIYNAKIYVFIIIQIAIAIFILNASLTLSVNSGNKLEKLLEDNKDEVFYINVKDITNKKKDYAEYRIDEEFVESNYEVIPFSNESLEELSKMLSNMDWKVEVDLNVDILLQDNTIQTVGVIYRTGINEVLMSEDNYNIFINSKEILDINNFPYKINGKKLVDIDGELYQITIKNDMNSEVYIPYELYYKLYHPRHLIDTRLSIRLKDLSPENREYLLRAQSFLSSNNNFIYYLNNEFYDTLANLNSVTEENAVFRFISYILLSITTIGLTGVFILIINERKKEIAINLALGCSKKRICMEYFIELIVLALIGCLLGLSSNIMFRVKEMYYINVSLSPNSNVIISQLLIICFIAVISMIPAIKIVVKLTPMEILRVE